METKSKKKQEEVPEVGKLYHFWDDGKTSSSRHYICKCEELITKEQAQSVIFDECIYCDYPINLYDIWRIEVDNHRQGKNFKVLNGSSTDEGEPWLYAEDTDFFVRLSCPTYDKNDLWAVRTVDGGWFTMDIQSSWMGGTLDVSGKIYDGIIQEYIDEGYDISGYTEATYEK